MVTGAQSAGPRVHTRLSPARQHTHTHTHTPHARPIRVSGSARRPSLRGGHGSGQGAAGRTEAQPRLTTVCCWGADVLTQGDARQSSGRSSPPSSPPGCGAAPDPWLVLHVCRRPPPHVAGLVSRLLEATGQQPVGRGLLGPRPQRRQAASAPFPRASRTDCRLLECRPGVPQARPHRPPGGAAPAWEWASRPASQGPAVPTKPSCDAAQQAVAVLWPPGPPFLCPATPGAARCPLTRGPLPSLRAQRAAELGGGGEGPGTGLAGCSRVSEGGCPPASPRGLGVGPPRVMEGGLFSKG